jgi:diaminopimelate decarboxylase
MHHFQYQKNELYGEQVPIEAIAAAVGTPFYLYSQKTLETHFTVFDNAFGQLPHVTCYSVKANSNLSILRIFSRRGAGADVVSGGELYRALAAGMPAEKIVYSGVGKKPQEISYAIEAGILMFNVESPQELELIETLAQKAQKKARIALRVNPDINPGTHPYISTGLRENKFGINLHDAVAEYKNALQKKHIEIVGIACHIGSQITEVGPFVEAMQTLRNLVSELIKNGLHIKYLDLGGGLGITYKKETPPHPEQYAQAVMQALNGLPVTLILEPGRVLVGNAGILVTKVLYTKQSGEKNFIVVDAGMNDLIRPSLYGSYQGIQPVRKRGGKKIAADIVGPICESGDFLAKKRKVPAFEPGDLMAVMSAGAYGFSMSSNYNSRPRVPEVLVSGDSYYVIRAREAYDDLIRGEKIPEHLKLNEQKLN